MSASQWSVIHGRAGIPTAIEGDMRAIYDSYEEAKAVATGKHRVYRVSGPSGQVVFAVALSPRSAFGEAGPAMGLNAELMDPHHVGAKRERELASTLKAMAATPEQLLRLRDALDGLLDGMK